MFKKKKPPNSPMMIISHAFPKEVPSLRLHNTLVAVLMKWEYYSSVKSNVKEPFT